ncbi:MAG: Rpn family recombination-promoting nuclease/putative transposase [Gammaproteobacteria bacterium]|nr:Rpn family recombination-promoting nuclease/putative transposase [Gammaproteobacteria bacterium]
MDEFYKIVFAFPRVVRDLVRGFLPEPWTGDLDLDRLELLPTAYVSDGWRTRYGDRTWKIPYRQDAGRPPGAYVVLLLEFQSEVDATMPVRMLVYTGLLFQELLRRHQGLSAERVLPHVVPMVVYNGRRRWNAPLSMNEMALPGSAAMAEFQPRQSYLALDEWQRSTDDLPRDNLVSSLVALETSQGKALDLAVAELAGLLNDPVDVQIRRAFRDWIERLRPRRTRQPGRSYTAMLMEEPMTLLESVNERLQKYYDELERQAVERGLEQGLEQGRLRAREQFLVEERALLRRMAERRFGTPVADRLASVLAHIADNDGFAAVGDAIVDSASGDELIGRVGANDA